MKYALIDGLRREPERKGEQAKCPGCDGALQSKFGEINIPHWAHWRGRDCDRWFEAEKAWHRAWKALVKPDAQEVTFRRHDGHHRADIVGNRRRVIELQHSPISPEHIHAREAFYGSMVWVFDARRFAAALRGFWTQANQLVDPFCARAVEFHWERPRKVLALATKPVYLDLGTALPGDPNPCAEYGDQLDMFWHPCRIDVPRHNLMLRIESFAGTRLRARPISREMFIHRHLLSVLAPENVDLSVQVSRAANTRLLALKSFREDRDQARQRRKRERLQLQVQLERERTRQMARAQREARERESRIVRSDHHRRTLLAMPWEELEDRCERISAKFGRRLWGATSRSVCEPPRGIPEQDWVLYFEYQTLVVQRREAWLEEVDGRAKCSPDWWLRQRERVFRRVQQGGRLPRRVYWLWQRLASLDTSAGEARSADGKRQHFHDQAQRLASTMNMAALSRAPVAANVFQTRLRTAARRLLELWNELDAQRAELEQAVARAHYDLERQRAHLKDCQQKSPGSVPDCLAQIKPLAVLYADARTDFDLFMNARESRAKGITRAEFECLIAQTQST